MIFKVPDNYKGSFTLNTVERPLWAGVTISIDGFDINAPDVKSAVNSGALVPVEQEKSNYEKIAKKGFDASIINKTNEVLILGEKRIPAKGTLRVDKNFAFSAQAVTAQNRGIITIVSDEPIPVKKESKKVEKIAEKIEVDETVIGGEREVVPVVWDPKRKENIPAPKVPRASDPLEADEETEVVEVKKAVTKKNITKKNIAKKKNTTKKKTASKKTKKKEMTQKKVKTNPIAPVGEVREEVSVLEADMNLDSIGNPIKKASDELQHLIDAIESKDEHVPFVDQEQDIERVKKRIEDS